MATPAPSEPAPSSRDKILDTAEPLFARFGFAGVGLREVAERVGMGKSSLFHHFPSKVQLYVAVIERVYAEFDARLQPPEGAHGSPAAQLHAWAEAAVRMLAEHPDWAALLLRTLFEGDVIEGENKERVDAVYARVIGRVLDTLNKGVAEGEFRPISPPHVLQTLIGMTIFHFASGDLGDDLFGGSVYSPDQVEARLAHLRDYIDHGLRAG